MMQIFQQYMQRCEELSGSAHLKGNPPVGAVIIFNDQIVAEAEEATAGGDITRHAEMEAIRKAVAINGKELSGHTLITTHEPCAMCSYAIRYHGIERVVYRTASKYLGGINSDFNILTTDQVPPHWNKAPKIVHYKK